MSIEGKRHPSPEVSPSTISDKLIEKLGTPEFPALNEKDLQEIENLQFRLGEFFGGAHYIGNFKQYTGLNEGLGAHSYYNSPPTTGQVLFAMAMTRSSLLTEAIEKQQGGRDFNIQPFIDAKIMQGMKILDLGSGPQPVFARCCRYMGANVWTVDAQKIDTEYDDAFFLVEQQKLEQVQHINLDLSSLDAIQQILERTQGNFNLSTSANLIPMNNLTKDFSDARRMSMELLKPGGVYYRSEFMDATLKPL